MLEYSPLQRELLTLPEQFIDNSKDNTNIYVIETPGLQVYVQKVPKQVLDGDNITGSDDESDEELVPEQPDANNQLVSANEQNPNKPRARNPMPDAGAIHKRPQDVTDCCELSPPKRSRVVDSDERSQSATGETTTSPDVASRLAANLSTHRDTLLRCLNPNSYFCAALSAKLLLMTGDAADCSSDFDPRVVQQLKSPTRIDFEKNELLLDWFARWCCRLADTSALQKAFVTALRRTNQTHLAVLLDGRNESRTYDCQLTSEERRRITLASVKLSENLLADTKFLCELRSRGVLSDYDYQCLSAERVDYKRNVQLVDILIRGSRRSLCCFVDVLKATNQPHLVELLNADLSPVVHPLSVDIDLLSRSLNRLRLLGPRSLHCLDPTGCLVMELTAQLCSRGSELDERVRQRLRSEASTDCEKNVVLLRWLLESPLFCLEAFINALYNSRQPHVVTALLDNTDEVCDIPLTDNTRRRLIRITPTVAQILDFGDELQQRLKSTAALTWTQLQRLNAEPVEFDRTVKLMENVQRGSVRSLDRVRKALQEATNRPYIGEYLRQGEIVGLHIDLLNVAKTDKDVIEERIVAELTEYTRQRCTDDTLVEELDTLLSELKLVKVRKVNSLLMFLYRENVREMETLTERLETGQLKNDIDAAFGRIVGSTGITVAVRLDDPKRFKSSYRQLQNLVSTGIDQNISRCTNKELQRPIDQTLLGLPVELLELILHRSFRALFTDDHASHHKTHEAVRQTYTTLAAVCYNWWRTMKGWPQSQTRHWFRHKLHRSLNCDFFPYRAFSRLHSSLCMGSLNLEAVVACDDKLFVIQYWSNAILVFGPNNERLSDIVVDELREPKDMVVCPDSRHIFVSGLAKSCRCVWRISLDDASPTRIEPWLTDDTPTASEFRGWALSVKDGRLLATSLDNGQLIRFGADGCELNRISPRPTDMCRLCHAVETSRATIVVSHHEPKPCISEMDFTGSVFRVYDNELQLRWPCYLASDSDGRVFVADWRNSLVLLLDSDLKLWRVLLEAKRTTAVATVEQVDRRNTLLARRPSRMCYAERTGQLVVGSHISNCVQVFNVRQHRAKLLLMKRVDERLGNFK